MFFHQDDFGLLVLLEKLPLWQFVLTPQSEHFAPIRHLVYVLIWHFFHLNFIPHLILQVTLHFIVVLVLAKIVWEMTGKRIYGFVAAGVFIVNQTYTEVFLALNPSSLAMFFIGLAFLYWWRQFISPYPLLKGEGLKGEVRVSHRYFWYSLFFILLAGFTLGIGTGVGLVFGVATLVVSCKLSVVSKKRSEVMWRYPLIYFLAGIFSFFIGPILAPTQLESFTPRIGEIGDILGYLGFIIVGISRGVVGRLMLPGFEPPNEDVVGTVVSFVPFVVIVGVSVWIWKRNNSHKNYNHYNRYTTAVLWGFVVYPYVWAGFLRAHFGLKQALAERYAYPSLFFLAILIALFCSYLWKKGIVRSQKVFIIFVIVIFLVQSIAYAKKVFIFTQRTREEKRYIEDYGYVLRHSSVVLDLPLPKVINQDYISTRDLAPLLVENNIPRFIKPKGDFCTKEFKNILRDDKVLSFYEEQAEEPFVGKKLDKNLLEKCIRGL